MEHRLATARAAHKGAILAAFVRDLVPQIYGKQVSIVLVIELTNFGVAVGIRTVRAAEVTRVDDGDYDLKWKFFRSRPRPQAHLAGWFGDVRHLVPLGDVKCCSMAV